ncbi:MAG: hypothetical protein JXR94_09090 [Candidatus Hydrogenedentes bacterium]|nr:hypothetical protein [Candidatus Hydrogenedentota bacterium]
MNAMLAAAVCIGAAAADAPVPAEQGVLTDSYLLRAERALQLARDDVPAMTEAADRAAARLAAGGAFYAAGQASMVSELCGRAGGFMALKSLGSAVPADGDVVVYSQPPGEPIPDGIGGSAALVIVLGGTGAGEGGFGFPNHAAEAGISPTLANAIPGWLFTGELVAALTRLGKMPVMFESIGMYGGYARMARYREKGIFWHDEHSVPALPGGEVAGRYIDTVSGMLRRVEAEERGNLNRAGAWAAEGKGAGHRVIMYSMGHLFPAEVADTAIADVFESAVWNSGFMQSSVPDHEYAPGDVLIHIGYQHAPYRLLERARPAGARVVYVDVMCHRDYTGDEDVIWIDPMWPWPDGCVALEGYDVPILPASGIVNGAIAWEIYRVTEACLRGE